MLPVAQPAIHLQPIPSRRSKQQRISSRLFACMRFFCILHFLQLPDFFPMFSSLSIVLVVPSHLFLPRASIPPLTCPVTPRPPPRLPFSPYSSRQANLRESQHDDADHEEDMGNSFDLDDVHTVAANKNNANAARANARKAHAAQSISL